MLRLMQSARRIMNDACLCQIGLAGERPKMPSKYVNSHHVSTRRVFAPIIGRIL